MLDVDVNVVSRAPGVGGITVNLDSEYLSCSLPISTLNPVSSCKYG